MSEETTRGRLTRSVKSALLDSMRKGGDKQATRPQEAGSMSGRPISNCARNARWPMRLRSIFPSIAGMRRAPVRKA